MRAGRKQIDRVPGRLRTEPLCIITERLDPRFIEGYTSAVRRIIITSC